MVAQSLRRAVYWMSVDAFVLWLPGCSALKDECHGPVKSFPPISPGWDGSGFEGVPLKVDLHALLHALLHPLQLPVSSLSWWKIPAQTGPGMVKMVVSWGEEVGSLGSDQYSLGTWDCCLQIAAAERSS
jgi:hypothetical protein